MWGWVALGVLLALVLKPDLPQQAEPTPTRTTEPDWAFTLPDVSQGSVGSLVIGVMFLLGVVLVFLIGAARYSNRD